MKTMFLMVVLLGLSNCAVYEPVPYVKARVYSAAEIDAINAEAECRRMARTSLQAVRCGPNDRR